MPDPATEDKTESQPEAGLPNTTPEVSGTPAEGVPPAVSEARATAAVGSPGPRKPNPVLEWFWRGHAMRAVQESGSALSPRGVELLRRSRLAAELGARTLEPPEPLPSGRGDALACELFRESVYWSLRAYREQGSVAREAATATALDESDIQQLWARTDANLIARTTGKEDPELLRKSLTERSFRDYAELDPAEQTRVANRLRAFAEALATALDVGRVQLERLWTQRLLRIGGLVVLLGVVLYGLTNFSELTRRDLTKFATWTASSKYNAEGCESPEQDCAGNTGYFFHTNHEKEPWVQFEFDVPRAVSGAEITNRLDCCQDRAVPLILEVSADGTKWTEVARRTSEFSTWSPSFDSVTAAFVRVRSPREVHLHLRKVKLFQ